MNSNNNKDLAQEISQEWKKSLQEVEKNSSLGKFKKKYLGKEGIIPGFFQHVIKESDLAKKKHLGSLVNQWKKELIEKIEEFEKKTTKPKKKPDFRSRYLFRGEKTPAG